MNVLKLEVDQVPCLFGFCDGTWNTDLRSIIVSEGKEYSDPERGLSYGILETDDDGKIVHDEKCLPVMRHFDEIEYTFTPNYNKCGCENEGVPITARIKVLSQELIAFADGKIYKHVAVFHLGELTSSPNEDILEFLSKKK